MKIKSAEAMVYMFKKYSSSKIGVGYPSRLQEPNHVYKLHPSAFVPLGFVHNAYQGNCILCFFIYFIMKGLSCTLYLYLYLTRKSSAESLHTGSIFH